MSDTPAHYHLSPEAPGTEPAGYDSATPPAGTGAAGEAAGSATLLTAALNELQRKLEESEQARFSNTGAIASLRAQLTAARLAQEPKPLTVNDAEKRYLAEVHETLPVPMSDFLYAVLRRPSDEVNRAEGEKLALHEELRRLRAMNEALQLMRAAHLAREQRVMAMLLRFPEYDEAAALLAGEATPAPEAAPEPAAAGEARGRQIPATGWCARCGCPVFGGEVKCSTCVLIGKRRAE